MKPPETSTTLLRDVGSSAQHTRWAVFHSRYEPMMRSFMNERFPSLDADDIIQETFIALAKALPRYVYNPKEKGHFHNYLTGVLRNKALKALAARNREHALREKVSRLPQHAQSSHEIDYRQWRESVYEIALQQLLADESIHERTKQVFARIAIDGDSPEVVARSLGMSRLTVNRAKERMLERLRKCVKAMQDV
mgnify:CR=1 FL=1